MSSQKTPNLNMHKWLPTDYVKLDEFNENFTKLDGKAKEITDAATDIDGVVQAGLPERLTADFGKVTAQLADISIDIKKYENLKVAIVDGYDWSLCVQAALDSNPTRGVKLYFPDNNGEIYYINNASEIEITKDFTTFFGEGLLKVNNAFRLRANHFACIGLNFEAFTTPNTTSCFRVQEMTKDVEGFLFERCSFKNFFYSINLDNDSSSYLIKNIKVLHCISTAPSGQNAGHFQNIKTYNSLYLGNKCYGGQNATSFNFVNGNELATVIGNYAEGNGYGALEVENGSKDIVITGNHFKSAVWFDDSDNIIFSNNDLQETLLLTCETYDLQNIIISNNRLQRLDLIKFGSGYIEGKKIDNVNVSGNTFVGTGQDKAISIGDVCKDITIGDNQFLGNYTPNIIGIARNANANIIIRDNKVNGNINITGTGGKVQCFDNENDTISGASDSVTKHLLLASDSDSLNVSNKRFLMPISANISGNASYDFVIPLTPTATYTARMIDITFTSRQQIYPSTFGVAEQKILVANQLGTASLLTATLTKPFDNNAVNISTSCAINTDGSQLTVTVTNLNVSDTITIMLEVLEHYNC